MPKRCGIIHFSLCFTLKEPGKNIQQLTNKNQKHPFWANSGQVLTRFDQLLENQMFSDVRFMQNLDMHFSAQSQEKSTNQWPKF